MAHLGVTLLQAATAVTQLRDTLVIKQLAPDRGALDQILVFGIGFIMLCLVAMVVTLIVAGDFGAVLVECVRVVGEGH